MNEKMFSCRKVNIIGEDDFQKYAVLVPIIETPEGLSLLFEKRSLNLKNQPGEICFPGGKKEEKESLADCAIRETIEELLVTKQQIKIIGPGDFLVTHFNVIIYPYLGVISEYKDTFNTDEVANIIKVPLKTIVNHQPKQYKSKIESKPSQDFPYELIPNGKQYPWSIGEYEIFFYQFDQVIIWGLTARILKSMIDLIKKYHLFDNIKF